MKLVEKFSQFPESATLKINSMANALRAEGKDVANFGAGEPDFNTPEYICDAAVAAMKAGQTKYTPATGTLNLRKAVAEKLLKDNNLKYDPSQIIVSSGAKHSLYNVIQVLCGPGDEVIVPTPYWVSYPAMVMAAGAETVYLETKAEEAFRLDPAKLEAAITPKTKVLILNSPSNPTGCIYDEKDLRAIADIVVRHDIACISDEIYEKLVYEGASHVSIASLNQEIFDRTIVVNGLSKSHAMTGWRIGYAAGPSEIMSAIAKLQAHSTSNPASISQAAAQAALEGGEEEINKMVETFNNRRKLMLKLLKDVPGIEVVEPKGAFYVMANIKSFFGKEIKGQKITTALDFAEVMLQEAYVAVVPGDAFGVGDYVRLSYATGEQTIENGISRMKATLQS